MTIGNTFVAVNEKNGVLQNRSNDTNVEFVVTNDIPKEDTGGLLLPNQKQSFACEVGYTMYVRATADKSITVTVTEVTDEALGTFTDLQKQKINDTEAMIMEQAKTKLNMKEHLDSRLALVVAPHRGIWGKYVDGEWVGIDIDDSLCHGSDYVEGNDLCINVAEGKTWQGIGTDNVFSEYTYGTSLLEQNGYVYTYTKDTAEGVIGTLSGLSGTALTPSTTYMLSWEYESAPSGVLEDDIVISIHNEVFDLASLIRLNEKSGTMLLTTLATELTGPAVYFRAGINSPAGSEVTVKIQLEKASVQTPYAANTRPEGVMKIKQNYLTDTHSIIMTGLKSTEGNRTDFAQHTTAGGLGNRIVVPVSADHDMMEYSLISNGTIAKAIFSNGDEVDCNIYDGSDSKGEVNLAYRIGDGETTGSSQTRDITCFYEGALTEDELRYELAKILADKIILEPTPTIELLPNTPQMADHTGFIKELITVQDETRDLPLITNAVYEFRNYYGRPFIDFIDSDKVITGDQAIEIVGNKVRVKSTMFADGAGRIKISK